MGNCCIRVDESVPKDSNSGKRQKVSGDSNGKMTVVWSSHGASRTGDKGPTESLKMQKMVYAPGKENTDVGVFKEDPLCNGEREPSRSLRDGGAVSEDMRKESEANNATNVGVTPMCDAERVDFVVCGVKESGSPPQLDVFAAGKEEKSDTVDEKNNSTSILWSICENKQQENVEESTNAELEIPSAFAAGMVVGTPLSGGEEVDYNSPHDSFVESREKSGGATGDTFNPAPIFLSDVMLGSVKPPLYPSTYEDEEGEERRQEEVVQYAGIDNRFDEDNVLASIIRRSMDKEEQQGVVASPVWIDAAGVVRSPTNAFAVDLGISVNNRNDLDVAVHDEERYRVYGFSPVLPKHGEMEAIDDVNTGQQMGQSFQERVLTCSSDEEAHSETNIDDRADEHNAANSHGSILGLIDNGSISSSGNSERRLLMETLRPSKCVSEAKTEEMPVEDIWMQGGVDIEEGEVLDVTTRGHGAGVSGDSDGDDHGTSNECGEEDKDGVEGPPPFRHRACPVISPPLMTPRCTDGDDEGDSNH